MNPIHNWIKDEPVKITCEISEFDFINVPLTYQHWKEEVIKKLKEAGIPFDSEGNVSEGTLKRFENSENIAKTTYEWNKY